MKQTNTLSAKRMSGMTLLELTVVILVLLSLITILFIGARAWKKGSDRSANILNIRNVQQAVRAHSNTRAMAIGDTLDSADIIGEGKYLNSVTAPNPEIVYDGRFASTIPAIGTLYLDPGYADSAATEDFAPTTESYSEW
jgi:type II secretory pathway pseudopilin PulG